MKYYELTYLVRPDIEQVHRFCEEINSLIQEEGGILEKIERPKKKALAYQVKKGSRYLNEAFLCSLSFYLDKRKIESLEEKLKKKQELLRFSLVRQKTKKALKPLREVPKRRKFLRKQKAKKVELKKIEEKIAELIGE